MEGGRVPTDVAAALVGEDVLAAGAGLLDALRRAVRADDLELFLSEPTGGDLLMAGCAGQDSAALTSMLRFGTGVGFPGLAAERRRTLATGALDRDGRFLRQDLVRSGIRGFVSVPLLRSGALLGTLSAGWRNAADCTSETLQLVEGLAAGLTCGVEAALAARRRRVRELLDLPLTSPADLPRRLESVLSAMLDAADAPRGTLLWRGLRSRSLEVVSRGAGAPPCACAAQGELGACSVLGQGHAALLRPSAADAGCDARVSGRTVCCVPLRVCGQVAGVVMLEYDAEAPSPATRHVVPLLSMAEEAGVLLRAVEAQSAVAIAASEPEISIRCLGQFIVRVGGEVISADRFGRRAAVRLLQILAMHAGRAVNRDALVEALWPEVDTDVGLNRLHVTVHALRNVLEPHSSRGHWRYICCDGDSFALAPEAARQVDVLRFRELIRAAGGAAHDRAVQLLEEAISLWHGDLFEDDPYATWCDAERTALREQYVQAQVTLARIAAGTGDGERAVGALRTALRAEPLREDLHRLLVETLLRAGRRGEAQAQYKACLRILREELGADPLPETRALERAMSRRRVADAL